jgi:hypothetical protein
VLVFVHFNPNTATSVLFDHTLSILTIFFTGVILGRRAAVVWFMATIASLLYAVSHRGGSTSSTR